MSKTEIEVTVEDGKLSDRERVSVNIERVRAVSHLINATAQHSPFICFNSSNSNDFFEAE